MRAGRKTCFIEKEGELFGIFIESDFCAEHEWGVKGINRDLGVPGVQGTDLIGVPARTITKCPSNLMYMEQGKRAALVLQSTFRVNDSVKEFFDHLNKMLQYDYAHGQLTRYGIAGLWDQDTFAVVVQDKDNIEKLSKFYEQFQQKNISIIYSLHVFHLDSGLGLVLADKLEELHGKEYKEADLSANRLQKASEATGIHEHLREHGKQWFSLRADWADKEETSLRFWLNPFDQENNNFGWFTVEELKQWAKGEGPIVKGNENT
jgi:hypothetical protein